MKQLFSVLSVALLVLVLFSAPQATNVNAKGDTTLLEWDSMVGVPKAYTGALSPIRGISGGGLPWVIGAGYGELSAGGKLEVTVRGLVFDPSDPDVIARGLAGRNTVASFKAIVSCQSVDSTGAAVVVNVSSPLVTATQGLATDGGGNARIETKLALPKPCIAPIVFIASPGGAWFAATGN
ncbi:MAG TPA: hypothetical protein PJ988_23000 [Anaerolinea sp.]|nr:hypothetical protein [Anaerolinea sp.]